MAPVSPQPDSQIVVQGSRNTTTATACIRNGPGMSESEALMMLRGIVRDVAIINQGCDRLIQRQDAFIQRQDVLIQEQQDVLMQQDVFIQELGTPIDPEDMHEASMDLLEDRASPLKEEHTQGQDMHEDSMHFFEDRAHPIKQEENTHEQVIHEDPMTVFKDRACAIKQEENTQPQGVNGPQDDISPK